MTFPVYFRIGSLVLHPHPVMEGLGYFVGARVFFYQRRRLAGAGPSFDETAWVFIGCIFGALLGSKLLAWAESPSVYWAHRDHPAVFLAGKSIVGGLLGGWMGVELAKRALGRPASLGDAFVLPLAVGTAIGRLGCFLTGLSDETYGTPTALPWGVDFGDHVRRHPTQLYESGFVMAYAAVLYWLRRRLRIPGERFRAYLAGYFTFRVLIEFIKPREFLVANLSAIQIAAFGGATISLVSWHRLRTAPSPPHHG